MPEHQTSRTLWDDKEKKINFGSTDPKRQRIVNSLSLGRIYE